MSGRKYASKKQKKSSKCDGKKKKVKKKKVIDYSVIEKNQDIDEREPVAGIDSEIPAESKVNTSKPKHKKARKSSSFTNFVSIPMQMEDIVSLMHIMYENKNSVKKLSQNCKTVHV